MAHSPVRLPLPLIGEKLHSTGSQQFHGKRFISSKTMKQTLLVLLTLMATTSFAGDTTFLYCFSGLGADERAFQRMELPPGYEARFIQWIKPEDNENLDHYAGRLSAQVDTTRPYSFLGLSFGGMVALTMSRQLQPRQIILVSSMSKPAQAAGIVRFLGKSGLYHIFPFGLFLIPNRFVYEAFGAKDEGTKKMLAGILKDTSIPFFRWAIGQMSHWPGVKPPPNCWHIHGADDKIIPANIVHADVLVPGAGHLMIYDHAAAVNKLLAGHLR